MTKYPLLCRLAREATLRGLRDRELHSISHTNVHVEAFLVDDLECGRQGVGGGGGFIVVRQCECELDLFRT